MEFQESPMSELGGNIQTGGDASGLFGFEGSLGAYTILCPSVPIISCLVKKNNKANTYIKVNRYTNDLDYRPLSC